MVVFSYEVKCISWFIFQGSGDVFLCIDCFNALEREYRQVLRSQLPTSTPKKALCCMKRRVTPSKTPRKVKKLKPLIRTPDKIADTIYKKKLFPKKSKKSGAGTNTLSAITKSLAASKYYTALNHILSRGEVAKRAFLKVMHKQVRCEILRYAKLDGVFPQLKDIESVSNFSWRNLLDSIQVNMPTVSALLMGLMPMEGKIKQERFEYVNINKLLSCGLKCAL